MSETTPVDLIIQTGALGLLGYVVWWLLKKFNGKLDAVVASTRENTEAIKELTRAVERMDAGR